LLAYAANYHGEETHHYLDNRYSDNVKDDRQIIEGLHHLLINSDIVIGHNMDRFDLKKFNTRAALFGLAPIPKLNSHDTLKMLKKLFVLPSNSLWYAAKFFKLGNQKMLHSKFPGDELFDQCLEGNMEAWEELELYNIQDVKTTKELFLFLARYDESVNFSIYEQYNRCICGSTDFKRDGFATKKSGKFARYRCKNCLKVFTLRCNEISAKIKSGIFS
jgi:DNA polymerase elongation subunit (family B)